MSKTHAALFPSLASQNRKKKSPPHEIGFHFLVILTATCKNSKQEDLKTNSTVAGNARSAHIYIYIYVCRTHRNYRLLICVYLYTMFSDLFAHVVYQGGPTYIYIYIHRERCIYLQVLSRHHRDARKVSVNMSASLLRLSVSYRCHISWVLYPFFCHVAKLLLHVIDRTQD